MMMATRQRLKNNSKWEVYGNIDFPFLLSVQFTPSIMELYSRKYDRKERLTMTETIEKLNREIQEGFDRLERLEVGSEEYNQVFKAVRDLEELRETVEESEADRDTDERRLRIEEKKADAELENQEVKERLSKREQVWGFCKTVLTVTGTLVATLMVTNAEQTAVISTKAIDTVSKAKKVFW